MAHSTSCLREVRWLTSWGSRRQATFAVRLRKTCFNSSCGRADTLPLPRHYHIRFRTLCTPRARCRKEGRATASKGCSTAVYAGRCRTSPGVNSHFTTRNTCLGSGKRCSWQRQAAGGLAALHRVPWEGTVADQFGGMGMPSASRIRNMMWGTARSPTRP